MNKSSDEKIKIMFKTNEYFEGKVKSVAYENETGTYTIGVMADGDYEFGTSAKEEMTVVNGTLKALLPGSDTWEVFPAGSTFHVAANVKFQVRAVGDTSYLCRYYINGK